MNYEFKITPWRIKENHLWRQTWLTDLQFTSATGRGEGFKKKEVTKISGVTFCHDLPGPPPKIVGGVTVSSWNSDEPASPVSLLLTTDASLHVKAVLEFNN